jgi:tripartite-type tricarboxylate transporter receptor subunit TctC
MQAGAINAKLFALTGAAYGGLISQANAVIDNAYFDQRKGYSRTPKRWRERTNTDGRTDMITRRTVIIASAASVAFGVRAASAANWPNRAVQAIVPFPPAGNVDITARLVGAAASAEWGQQLVVENRPGAGGNIGNEAVARSAPDGYTVLFTQGGIVVNKFLYKSLNYDVISDFAPISLLVIVPNVLVVPANSAAKTMQDFVTLAKSKALLYASAGNGTSSHLSGELLKRRLNVEMTHVPYRGTALAVTDLIGGRVDVTCDNVSALLPQIKSGALRALAVTTNQRLAVLPDVVTMAESGIGDFKSYGWTAVFAPAKTPSTIVDAMNKTIVSAIRRPENRAIMEEAGNVVVGSSPTELTSFVADEQRTWEPIIKNARITIG